MSFLCCVVWSGFRASEVEADVCPRPMGVVAGMVNKANQSAKEIIDEIVAEAAEILGSAGQYVGSKAKL